MFVNIGQCQIKGVKCFHCTHVFDITNQKLKMWKERANQR
jgi:hypothetical protein